MVTERERERERERKRQRGMEPRSEGPVVHLTRQKECMLVVHACTAKQIRASNCVLVLHMCTYVPLPSVTTLPIQPLFCLQ